MSIEPGPIPRRRANEQIPLQHLIASVALEASPEGEDADGDGWTSLNHALLRSETDCGFTVPRSNQPLSPSFCKQASLLESRC